jgi:type IV pilus assembly protein PilB
MEPERGGDSGPHGLDEHLRALLDELAALPGFENEAAVRPAPPRAAGPGRTPAPARYGEGPVVVPVPRSFKPDEEIAFLPHKRILVVDDNDEFRETLRSVLAGRGYEAHAARDGAGGMELALQVRPSLVITDFNMPRMNGYELVTRLRAHPETSGVPLILFTGSSNRRQLQGLHIERCLLLEKPFRNEVLFDAVADFIGLGLPGGRAAPAEAPPAAAPRLEPSLEAAAQLPPLEGPAAVVETQEAEALEEAALDEASESPMIARINHLMAQAIEEEASDIHFQPQADGVHVRLRVDGALRPVFVFPRSLRARLAARLKLMANLVITEKRLPQDGQIRAKVGGKRVEFRVSTMPGQLGEKVVLRVLGTARIKPGIAELGVSGRDRDAIERVLHAPHGLVLVTGPTGSGKTTTLYTMMAMLNRPDMNLVTAEDPVEYELPGLTQVQIKPQIGLTFEKVLRSFLRQDPDVLLLGEIRDYESAEIAIKASITGHLVLSTLHTNSAPATIVRLTQMGIAPYLTATSARLVVAQRLVRLLCPKCRQLSETPELDLKLLTEAEIKRVKRSWVGAGCPECRGTGYRGRVPLFEVMPVTSLYMRQAILESAPEDRLAKLAVLEGMTPLREAALEVVAQGQTSLEEAMPFIVGE